MICQSVVVKVASHVCKSWVSAPVIPLFHCHGCRSLAFALVVLHIELHGCRLRVFAPVGFNECCPELRQVPAQLRVLRNSPRAMPLFGLPIIVVVALYTSHENKVSYSVPVPMEVPRCTGADPALLLPSSLYFIVMGADRGFCPRRL